VNAKVGGLVAGAPDDFDVSLGAFIAHTLVEFFQLGDFFFDDFFILVCDGVAIDAVVEEHGIE